MWRSAVLTEMPSARATCLVCSPRASRATTSASRVRQARRTLETWSSLAGGFEHRCDRVGVEASGARLLGEDLRRSLGRKRGAVRPRLGHRVVGVGRGQQSGRQRELGAGRPAVIAGSVEALVVRSRDRGQCREERRARENSLAVVGVQANLLPFIGRQRTGLLPDPRVDRHPAEVVEKPRPADRGRALRIDAGNAARRPRRQLGDADGVTREVRRDQVGEISHRGKGAERERSASSTSSGNGSEARTSSHAEEPSSSARIS